MLVKTKKTFIKSFSIPERSDRHPHSLAVRLLELAHLRGVLHSEVDLVGVLSHNLQLDVIGVTHDSEITLIARESNTFFGGLILNDEINVYETEV